MMDEFDKIIEDKAEAIKNDSIQKNKQNRELVDNMIDPEYYVNMVIKDITDNPASFNPEIMKSIIRKWISIAMNVYAHEGHILSLSNSDEERCFTCIRCGKKFPVDNVPNTKLCCKGE